MAPSTLPAHDTTLACSRLVPEHSEASTPALNAKTERLSSCRSASSARRAIEKRRVGTPWSKWGWARLRLAGRTCLKKAGAAYGPCCHQDARVVYSIG